MTLNQKWFFWVGHVKLGKTTVAKIILGKNKNGYLNWDIADQREKILRHEWPNSSIWALDEIHKYKSWRNLLKGLYDAHGKN